MAKKRLGELLLDRGLIDVDQLNSALAYQRQWGHRLGTSMVAKGFISEGTLTRTLSESLQIPMVDLAKVVVDKRAVALLKATTAEQFEVFPIAVKEHKGRKTLLLAMADPLNVAAVDEVAFTTDMTVRPAIAQISSLRAAVRRYYYSEAVEIPPLDFSKKAPSSERSLAQGSSDDAEMTILRRGETVESVVDSSGEVIDLTKEVEAAERLQQMSHQMNQVNQQMGQAQMPSIDPFTGQPQTGQAGGPLQYFQGQPTGAYMMAMPQMQQLPGANRMPAGQPQRPPNTSTVEIMKEEPVEALEKKFWALMRVLARKGLITKEEFLSELKND